MTINARINNSSEREVELLSVMFSPVPRLLALPHLCWLVGIRQEKWNSFFPGGKF